MAKNNTQKKKQQNSIFAAFKNLKRKPKIMPDCRQTIQSSVPIYTVHNELNLIETYPGCFTKQYVIENINYQTASENEQDMILTKWRAFLNSLGTNMEMQLTIFSCNINMREFQEEIFLKQTGDNWDNLRDEMNKVQMSRIMEGNNGIEKDQYITLSVHTDSVKKAAEVFKRLDGDIDKHLKTMQSSAKVVPIEERLEILHDIYNIDNRGEFLIKTRVLGADGKMEEVSSFDFDNIRSMGLSVNDIIAPSSIVIKNKSMEIGNQYASSIRVTELPAILSDNFLVSMTDMPFNMLTTLTLKPLSNADTDKLINQQIAYIREEKNNLQKQLRRNNADESAVNPQLLEREEEVLNLRDEIRKNDEHLFEMTLSSVVFAPNETLLTEYTDTVISECKKASVTAEVLNDMQEEGFIASLPLCCNPLPMPRTLKSSSCAVMIPFSNLEINEKGGIVYTQNAVSKNLIRFNIENKMNYNAFVLGSSGCVDCDTEYFNGKEWKSIAKYKKGEQVLSYNPDTDEAALVTPERYIKEKCDKMYHFKTKYGIDQMLSPEHNVLYYERKSHRKKGDPDRFTGAKVMQAEELAGLVSKNEFKGYIKTSFKYNGPGIDLSDDEIKVMLAVISDGSFDSKAPESMKCTCNFKKTRKKNELFRVLRHAGIEVNVYECDNGYTRYTFDAPRREKEFSPYWYNCNQHQLQLICGNVLKWDGSVDTIGRKRFSTTNKASADFVQFAFSACGYRAVVTEQDRVGKKFKSSNNEEYTRISKEYMVHITDRAMVGIHEHRPIVDKVTEEVPWDLTKYCFTVPTHALVLRRNGRIFLTRNSGKSFCVKTSIINLFLSKPVDIIILDPEAEYTMLTQALGGQVFKIQPGGKNHLNPLDITSLEYDYDGSGTSTSGDVVDPILEKVSFILNLFESMLNKTWGMDSIQKTLIDDCLRELYAPFMKNGRLYRAPSLEETPTLNDVMEWMAASTEPEARELYFLLRRYAGEGTLNVFAQKTNIEIHNRIVCFDISAVGEELRLMAMSIIQDQIWSRLVENRRLGKMTHIIVDEIHVYFSPDNTSSAQFLATLYKRGRKYGACNTGITQNPADMLEHPIGKKLLSESNMIQILNQNSDENRERIKNILNISDSSLSYITNVPPGMGLFFTGQNTVPFYSKFPKMNADGTPNLIYPLLTSNAAEIAEMKERERRKKLQEQTDEKKTKYN